MTKKNKFLTIFFFLNAVYFNPNNSFANTENPENLPWMTGPLYANTASVVPRHYYDIQDYGYFTKTKSDPTKRSVKNDLLLENGCFKNIQCKIVINSAQDRSQKDTPYNGSGIGDINLSFAWQILKQNNSNLKPNIAIQFRETLPTGLYKDLSDPIQATGAGAFKTSISLWISRMFHISGVHYFGPFINFIYTLPTHANLSGISVYYPEPENVRLHIGQTFSIIAGFEYSLTKHWVPALEIWYTNNTKDVALNTPKLTKHSNADLTITPELEYNFNEHWGLIGGVQLDVVNKNSDRFTQYVLSLNYYS